MRRLKPQEKKRVGEFRLLRGIPLDVNLVRFKKHVKRLRRRLASDPIIRKFGLKNRRCRRVAALAARTA